MSHRRAHLLVLGLSASAIALVPACADEASDGIAPRAELPTTSVDLTDGLAVMPTATDLIRESYVVARGRFVGGPTVLETTPDAEELAHSLVVWEFVPDEVFRDVRTDDAPSRVAEDRRGAILVAASVTEVGRMRGAEPVEDFVRSFRSVSNLNSFPVDRPLYVFLRPGAMPRDAVARDPDLAHVMYVVDAQCYAVDDLERSCAYVADTPGGKPAALLEQGALVPDGLSPEAIEAAEAVTEVVESEYFRATAPVDLMRWTTVPEGGGEG